MKGLYMEEVVDADKVDRLKRIVKSIKPIPGQMHIERFHDNGEGEDRAYNVYKIITDDKAYVLKRSDNYEIEAYEKLLEGKNLPVPRFKGWTSINGVKWILIEYIEGKDLRDFDEGMAYGCAESLSKIFNTYWQVDRFNENRIDNRFERYWKRINKRAECLKKEPKISKAYEVFLNRQLECPRTMCNGDFLQCNAIETDNGIKLIDWAFSGIMPYSLDIARLISHGSEKYFPFPFYMTEEYRDIFVKEVYKRLNLKISYDRYILDIMLSCLNECIEFIEQELNDDSLERDEVFEYYYRNADYLSDLILRKCRYEKCIGEWNQIFQECTIDLPKELTTGNVDLDAALRWLSIDSRKVLDFGCGNGTILFLLSQMGVECLYGIDLSEDAVLCAVKRSGKAGFGEFHFTEGGVEALEKLDEKSFDAIVMSNIIDNLYPDDAVKVLAEAERVLRPEGKLLIKLNPYIEENQIEELNLAVLDNGMIDDGMLLLNKTTEEWEEIIGRYFKIEKYEEIYFDKFGQCNRVFLVSRPEN